MRKQKGVKEILLIPQGVVETEIQAMEQFFFDDLAGRSYPPYCKKAEKP